MMLCCICGQYNSQVISGNFYEFNKHVEYIFSACGRHVSSFTISNYCVTATFTIITHIYLLSWCISLIFALKVWLCPCVGLEPPMAQIRTWY